MKRKINVTYTASLNIAFSGCHCNTVFTAFHLTDRVLYHVFHTDDFCTVSIIGIYGLIYELTHSLQSVIIFYRSLSLRS